MEIASLFLLVLLPPADASGDMASAVEASLRHELGDIAMAIEPDTLVTPAMWQGEKTQMHARFVAHLVWMEKSKASIEIVSMPSAGAEKGATSTRLLTFSPQDSTRERGRAIGLVMAELMRESPATVLVGSGLGQAAVPAAGPSRVVLGGMFAVERANAGNWAMGPVLSYNFGLSDAFRLQASGTALFGSADQYQEIGMGMGVGWDFLHSAHGRHALGLGLEVDGLHESATHAGDNAPAASLWNMAIGGSLAGHVTLWRWLRVNGEVDFRSWLRQMAVTYGEGVKTTYHYSRWRPVFALGLEIAL